MKQHKDYGRKKFIVELERKCHDFLLHGIRNGAGRVERHFAIANVIYEFKTGNIQKDIVDSASDYTHFEEILEIHNTSQKVTSYLDRIGYRDDLEGDEWDRVAKRMSRELIKLFKIKVHER